MLSRQPNIRLHSSARTPRRGATLVEYLLVVYLVGCGILGSVYLFTAAGDQFQDVASTLGGTQSEAVSQNVARRDVALGSLAESEAAVEAAEAAVDYKLFAFLLTLGITAIGILYVRLAYKRHTEKEEAGAARRGQTAEGESKISAALEQVFRKRTTMRRQLDESWQSFIDGRGTAEDFMSTELFTILPQTSIADAKKLLDEKGFRRVLVVKENGKLAGIVSKKDLARPGKVVDDVMTSDPVTAKPDLRISVALSMMLQARISCVPVVKDGFLVGLLSTSDLMMLLQCVLFMLEEKHDEQQPVELAEIMQKSTTKKAVAPASGSDNSVGTPETVATR